MGVKFSELPILDPDQVSSDDYIAILDTSDGVLKRTTSEIPLPVNKGGTGNTDGYIRTGRLPLTVIGNRSTAEGSATTAEGDASHAEGSSTAATADAAHAEGLNSLAAKTAAHAEGTNTIASGESSHAEGLGTTASGDYSHASGEGTIAGYSHQTVIGKFNSNQSSTLFEIGIGTSDSQRSNALEVASTGDVTLKKNLSVSGSVNIATSLNVSGNSITPVIANPSGSASTDLTKLKVGSTIYGIDTGGLPEYPLSVEHGGTGNTRGLVQVGHSTSYSIDQTATAEGYNNVAQSSYAHAEGSNNNTQSSNSHVEGDGNKIEPSSNGAHAEGYNTTVYYYSEGAHAEGKYTKASEDAAHAEGDSTEASGDASHAEGSHSKATKSQSHAEGSYTEATGDYAHSEGRATIATNECSHAEGYSTEANGKYSHAEGEDSSVYEDAKWGHAEGYHTEVYGEAGHAEGYFTEAYGKDSHAEGNNSVANGDHSHAGGVYTYAGGECSFIHGKGGPGASMLSVYPDCVAAFGDFVSKKWVSDSAFTSPGTCVATSFSSTDCDNNARYSAKYGFSGTFAAYMQDGVSCYLNDFAASGIYLLFATKYVYKTTGSTSVYGTGIYLLQPNNYSKFSGTNSFSTIYVSSDHPGVTAPSEDDTEIKVGITTGSAGAYYGIQIQVIRLA